MLLPEERQHGSRGQESPVGRHPIAHTGRHGRRAPASEVPARRRGRPEEAEERLVAERAAGQHQAVRQKRLGTDEPGGQAPAGAQGSAAARRSRRGPGRSQETLDHAVDRVQGLRAASRAGRRQG